MHTHRRSEVKEWMWTLVIVVSKEKDQDDEVSARV
jgi:hypothetical protein